MRMDFEMAAGAVRGGRISIVLYLVLSGTDPAPGVDHIRLGVGTLLYGTQPRIVHCTHTVVDDRADLMHRDRYHSKTVRQVGTNVREMRCGVTTQRLRPWSRQGLPRCGHAATRRLSRCLAFAHAPEPEQSILRKP